MRGAWLRGLIAAVFRKELRDHMRDRRSLMTLVFATLMGPLAFSVMIGVLATQMRRDKPLELAVVGRQHAPGLVAWLERSGTQLSEAPADYEEQVRAGKLHAVLVVPEDYGQQFSSGHTAKVQLVIDRSRQASAATVARAEALLQAYGGLTGVQRLLARGVAPELARPLAIQQVNLATPASMAALLLGIFPFFLILTAFLGGLNVAIDTMAGERERGSLEPLLLNPVPLGALVVGKWLTTVCMSVVAVALSVGAFMVAVRYLPLEQLGVSVRLDGPAALGMLLAALPLTLTASALQMLVATFARSYKEGQTYLQFLNFLPGVPGMWLAFSPVQTKLWMYVVPVFGQTLLTSELLRGEAVGALPFVLGTVSCVVVAAMALALNARLLRDERIVFGRSS